MTSVPSEDSDLSGHPRSQIRVFAVRSMGSQGPNASSCGQQRSDQTGRMPRLIRVFTGRTGHFVSFVVGRLKCRVIFTSSMFRVTFAIKDFLHGSTIEAV